MEKEIKTHKRKNKTPVDPGDLVSEKSLQRNYKIIGKVSNSTLTMLTEKSLNLKGEGVERLLVKGKKADQVEEIDGDTFRYYLLAGECLFPILIEINSYVISTRYNPSISG